MWVLESNPPDEQQVIVVIGAAAGPNHCAVRPCFSFSKFMPGGEHRGSQPGKGPAGPRHVLSSQTFQSCDSRELTSLSFLRAHSSVSATLELIEKGKA